MGVCVPLFPLHFLGPPQEAQSKAKAKAIVISLIFIVIELTKL